YVEPTRFLTRSATASLSPQAQRFVVLTGLIASTALLGRLVFGYWRLRVMKPAEAGMVLQDAGWDESRRELVRVEGWRRWGRDRATRREQNRTKRDRRAPNEVSPFEADYPGRLHKQVPDRRAANGS